MNNDIIILICSFIEDKYINIVRVSKWIYELIKKNKHYCLKLKRCFLLNPSRHWNDNKVLLLLQNIDLKYHKKLEDAIVNYFKDEELIKILKKLHLFSNNILNNNITRLFRHRRFVIILYRFVDLNTFEYIFNTYDPIIYLDESLSEMSTRKTLFLLQKITDIKSVAYVYKQQQFVRNVTITNHIKLKYPDIENHIDPV